MEKYDWNLTRMFKDEKEYKSAINEVNELLNKIIEYKGRILNSSETLFELLELDSRIDYLLERLYVYSFLGYYINMSDVKFIKYKEEITALCNKASSLRSFITPELLSSNFDIIEKYIKENKNLEKYRFLLEKTYRYKSHVLSEKEEKLLSNANDIFTVMENTYEQLDNVDIKFDKVIDENGKKVELNAYNYTTFLSSKNRKVRRDAFKKEYKFYKEHINTISSLYIGQVKTNAFLSKTRNYDSILDMALFDDKIDKSLYKNLIKITNKNVKYLQDFYKLKSKVLNHKMHMYDLYVNISSINEKKISYEEGVKIVNNALKPLGKYYLDKFNYLLNNNCVDVYPKRSKRSGAYEWGSYKVLPYVSLNYENNIESVSTLSHEMGHAMHSYLSNENQDYIYAGYPIFLAEIASTVNEILLSNYLINNTNDKNEKIYYLVEFLDKFKSTVYRQVMFAEFESDINEKYENNEQLTMELLCDTYLKLNKKYFGSSVIVDDDIKYEWARIPHFYTPFYVYKYATGFISALIIADKLLNDNENFRDKYIEFLSSGGSDYPLNLLKKLGIDISDEKVLNRAFEIFNENLKLLESLESGE